MDNRACGKYGGYCIGRLSRSMTAGILMKNGGRRNYGRHRAGQGPIGRLKPLLFGSLLLLLIVIATFFWFQNSEPDKSDFLTLEHTESIDAVHQKFGLPQRTLSGFWGDVYIMEDGTEIIIYYGEDGLVSQVKEN